MISDRCEKRVKAVKYLLWASVASVLAAAPQGAVLAQSGRDQVPNQTANASMINLILQMVKQGSVTPANGAILIQEALGTGGGSAQQGYALAANAQASAAAPQDAQRTHKGRATLPPVVGIGQARAQILAQPGVQEQMQAQLQAPPAPQYAPPPPQQFADASDALPPPPPMATPLPAQAYVPSYAPQQGPAPRYAAPAPQAAPSRYAAAQADAQPAMPAPAQPAPQPAPPAAPAAPTIRVSYVPESVRKQIAEEVRAQVMQQAKAEGWAAPGDASPDWVRKITISGDIRARSQSELYSRANANDLLDYAAFNAVPGGSDITNVQNLAFLNTTKDRFNRMRVRARLGVTANLSKQVEAGFRIAGGDDPSPISTDQLLGGGLAKKDIWLDRAYLKLRPTNFVDLSFGRFANPFHTTELLFDEDLNFDGVAAEVRADRWMPSNVSLALRGGAFPLDFGSPAFPNTETEKRKYPAKWLFSAQLEAGFKPAEDFKVSATVGYHDFHNVQGRLSDPCLFNGVDVKNPAGNGTVAADPLECSSDGTRSFFPRKGNTLFFIRNLTTPDVNGVALERQYLGLVYKYRVLDLNLALTGQLNDNGVNATLSGDYVRNLGFKRSDECRYGAAFGPFTNVKATSGIGNACAGEGVVQSGNMGWWASLSIGHDRPHKWGQWRAQAGYRYLQSDAVLDSLTDSDFHLGGTNAKGYTIGGTLGLFDGVSLGGRWLSANEITGRPLSIDVLQFDLLAEF